VIANAKQPNAYGRLIDRMRFGIVANGNQPTALNMQIDCAGILQATC
jgi:hypothetical protein